MAATLATLSIQCRQLQHHVTAEGTSCSSLTQRQHRLRQDGSHSAKTWRGSPNCGTDNVFFCVQLHPEMSLLLLRNETVRHRWCHVNTKSAFFSVKTIMNYYNTYIIYIYMYVICVLVILLFYYLFFIALICDINTFLLLISFLFIHNAYCALATHIKCNDNNAWFNWTEWLQDYNRNSRSKLSKIRLESDKVKQSTGLTLDQENQRFHLSDSTHASSLKKHGVFDTHNAAQPLSNVTGGNFSDYVQLPLEPQMAFVLLFSHMQSCVKLAELPFKLLETLACSQVTLNKITQNTAHNSLHGEQCRFCVHMFTCA